MSWVDDEFRERQQVSRSTSETERPSIDAAERRTWSELVSGLRRDVEDFTRLGGTAELDETSNLQCRVSNAKAKTAVTLIADLDAHAIRYSYQPQDGETAVPDGGVLSLRSRGRSAEIYSADQRLSTEDARRLILEPLLFPRAPLQGLEPTGT